MAVILGETGRNFAAGMSGGIAYVLDETGTFPHAGEHGDGRARRRSTIRRIRTPCSTLVRKHVEYTGSTRGRWVLDNWPQDDRASSSRSCRLDYKRALAELKKAAVGNAGRTSWQEVAHG